MNLTLELYGDWADMPTGRHVYTVVVDTANPTPEDRIRLFIDGEPGPTNAGVGFDGTEVIDLGSDSSLCVGNSPVLDRELVGSLYYAAYYGAALTPEEVRHNATRLLENDD